MNGVADVAVTRPRGWGVRDLTVRYGTHTALDRVTLDVPAGAVTAVIGGDGAGKTTLLRALAGVVPASSGSVCGPDRRQIGYVAGAAGVYGDLSVDENIEFVAGAYGLTTREREERSAELLARTGLTGTGTRLAGRLSGGMRQKLAFALAMLHDPELLVLDEPTTGVDPVSRADLWRLIAGAAAAGAAVVVTTTYLDEALRAASVLLLEDGRATALGDAAGSTAAGGAGTHAQRRPARPASPGSRCSPSPTGWCAASARSLRSRTSTSSCGQARWSVSSAPTAPARRHSSGCSWGCCARRPGGRCSSAGRHRGRRVGVSATCLRDSASGGISPWPRTWRSRQGPSAPHRRRSSPTLPPPRARSSTICRSACAGASPSPPPSPTSPNSSCSTSRHRASGWARARRCGTPSIAPPPRAPACSSRRTASTRRASATGWSSWPVDASSPRARSATSSVKEPPSPCARRAVGRGLRGAGRSGPAGGPRRPRPARPRR